LANQLFQGDATVLLILVVDDLGLVIGIAKDVLGDIDKLDPLLFGGCFPSSKPALIEKTDDFIERVYLFPRTNTPHIRILRIDF
jgi:hypothetical protein